MKRSVGIMWGALVSVALASAAWCGETPTNVARAYLSAMDEGKLDDAEALFAAESSIFETGGTEGSWQHYREHHIGPELDAIALFETTLGDPEEIRSEDASMAVVAWPIEYRIELEDEKVIESRGTVTFVLVQEGDDYRIRHLH